MCIRDRACGDCLLDRQGLFSIITAILKTNIGHQKVVIQAGVDESPWVHLYSSGLTVRVWLLGSECSVQDGLVCTQIGKISLGFEQKCTHFAREKGRFFCAGGQPSKKCDNGKCSKMLKTAFLEA